MVDEIIKQKQVYDVLVTPIICDKTSNEEKIVRKNGVIFSSQKYCREADPDMSDLAISFYQILYNEKLIDFDLLDNQGYLKNKEFAGDTMNSFTTIANGVVSNELQFKGRKLNISVDPYLIYYKCQYHCLANFWLIPMRDGRQSSKRNKYDSLDLYLEYLKDNWESLKKEEKVSYGRGKYISDYDNYFRNKKLKDFNNFCKIHYVKKSEADILSLYKNHRYVNLMDIAITSIFERAKSISTDKEIYSRLYDYFKMKGIVDIYR